MSLEAAILAKLNQGSAQTTTGVTVPGASLANSPSFVNTNVGVGNGRKVGSGVLVAGAYPVTPQVSVVGSGSLSYLGFGNMDMVSRATACKLVIDGNIVAEVAPPAWPTANRTYMVVGSPYSTYGSIALDNIPFALSLEIFLKSDISETDGSWLGYLARVG